MYLIPFALTSALAGPANRRILFKESTIIRPNDIEFRNEVYGYFNADSDRQDLQSPPSDHLNFENINSYEPTRVSDAIDIPLIKYNFGKYDKYNPDILQDDNQNYATRQDHTKLEYDFVNPQFKGNDFTVGSTVDRASTFVHNMPLSEPPYSSNNLHLNYVAPQSNYNFNTATTSFHPPSATQSSMIMMNSGYPSTYSRHGVNVPINPIFSTNPTPATFNIDPLMSQSSTFQQSMQANNFMVPVPIPNFQVVKRTVPVRKIIVPSPRLLTDDGSVMQSIQNLRYAFAPPHY
ncbi:hypothetical protein GJ496_011507 [Pomphorhynchus laevis]|nr:hypothetical protein GJ496_011507 [Pomphorhynchus laevis]